MSTTVEQPSTDAHTAQGALTAATTATTTAAAAAAAATVAATSASSTEIEQLQQALLEKQTQLYALETACLRETERQVELEDSVIAWQDKYDRLYESHKRVQKVNQSLEDKMLKLVDRNTNERAQLTSDVATLSVRLAQANFNIAKLQREIERYKADISLAIQLLQCKPDSFVPQKVSSLPIDIQSKVSAYMRLETNSHSDSECSNSGVGVATTASYKVLPVSDSPPPAPCPFPPTAMVYSMRGLGKYATNGNSANAQTTPAKSNNNNNNNTNNNNNSSSTKDTINNNNNSKLSSKFSSSQTLNGQTKTNNNNNNNNNNADPDMISPTVMAKFLEDELKLNDVKHCDTCQCSKQDLTVLADISRSYTVATQTPYTERSLNEPLTQLCLRCHSNLNSPSRTNSPYLMKLVKSSDSVISETKSSVSDLNDMDKLFTPPKKDDLMVNPILGHHRLCERTANSSSTLMYPTTHLGAYAAEKYLLETSNLGQLRQGNATTAAAAYQRRFLDGGGTALQLLNKFEGASVAAAEELEDEEVSKPLLAGISQPSLLEAEQPPSTQPTKPEDVCEPQPVKPAVAAAGSPKHSANSSSLSDAIDYQESVLLRRQQLNRVAEWVQHNTQQLEQRALQQPTLPSGSNSGTERQSSYSTLDRMDSISIEKLSVDSGYKTTPQQLTNGYADAGKSTEDSLSPKTDITSNSLPEPTTVGQAAVAAATVVTKKAELCTTYYRRTTRSGLPVAYTTTMMPAAATPADSQGCSSSGSPALQCPEQPTCDILNYKYYPNDTDKTRSVQAELHTTTQHVDIAQMEYNVKQFLLKQNEWSMRAEGAAAAAAAAGGGGAAGGPGGARLMRHTRLMGPGVGERVRMATPGGAVAATPGVLGPHRTETNL
ncbi:uncharacterized protein LOC108651446 isoform X3 [Drosophila navojoa]|uniref:uncharacterized protein LOC108651446 isoform X3 n=1 Tax=Drosophila navojoa TaxID=7232 RepID=UPI000846B20B|nr:uncharacterized protein LOC108651446 isoform X3 [Drosophila navojoa]